MNKLASVVVAAAFAAQGCGAGTAETSTDGALKADSALLFEDHYSGTGTIRVYDHGEHFSVQILGKLGVDDHLAMGQLLASNDLPHVYLALHPEARTAPDDLVAIDARWARLREASAERSAEAAGKELAPAPAALPLTDKSRSSFLNTACQTFGTWFDGWVPDLCRYTEATGIVQSDCTRANCSNQWIHRAGDRAFMWNESTQPALVGFFDVNSQGVLVNHQEGSQPPRTWGWYSNDFDLVNYGMQMERDVAKLGVTHHFHQVIPR